MSSRTTQILSIMLGVAFVAACEDDIPPRSTTEFVENPIMLEAALVRCSQDRAATRYDAECINARQAISQIEAKEEAARRSEHEERSESKRKALRRTQEAAAQARRRSAEAERLREEAEYLAQFGVVPSTESSIQETEPETGNVPQAVIPASDANNGMTSGRDNTLPATDGGNAPGSAAGPEEKPASDLESIRDELQRRNEEGAN